jgi:hypothetical protein
MFWLNCGHILEQPSIQKPDGIDIAQFFAMNGSNPSKLAIRRMMDCSDHDNTPRS